MVKIKDAPYSGTGGMTIAFWTFVQENKKGIKIDLICMKMLINKKYLQQKNSRKVLVGMSKV